MILEIIIGLQGNKTLSNKQYFQKLNILRKYIHYP